MSHLREEEHSEPNAATRGTLSGNFRQRCNDVPTHGCLPSETKEGETMRGKVNRLHAVGQQDAQQSRPYNGKSAPLSSMGPVIQEVYSAK
eukprot:3784909-Amphidinium_carterae.1